MLAHNEALAVAMLNGSQMLGLRAVAASEESVRLLGVEPGTPLLSVERIAFSYGDRPVEWRRGLYATAQHYYLNELN